MENEQRESDNLIENNYLYRTMVAIVSFQMIGSIMQDQAS